MHHNIFLPNPGKCPFTQRESPSPPCAPFVDSQTVFDNSLYQTVNRDAFGFYNVSDQGELAEYNVEVLERGVGIRFDGAEKTTVEEYCVSEGWIRVAVGKTVDRRGNPLTIKLRGVVEPYYRTAAPEA